jgi:hypothetical protein
VIAERTNFVTSGGSAQAGATSLTTSFSLNVASFAMSAATNGVSTIVIACKAWYAALHTPSDLFLFMLLANLGIIGCQ